VVLADRAALVDLAASAVREAEHRRVDPITVRKTVVAAPASLVVQKADLEVLVDADRVALVALADLAVAVVDGKSKRS
jgi:tetrahydromethanopterin S-methyltransferase subunit H